MSRVYLDHASAWPLRPEAARAWADAVSVGWADPGRRYGEARAARALLEQATSTAALRLGADDVVWTGSGTEAVALAVVGGLLAAQQRGDPRSHLVVSAVEHSSVLTAAANARTLGATITTVPVDRAGRVAAEAVREAIRPDTLAVHLQHANHEVGTLQPTHEVGVLCREADVALHVDAAQTAGQLTITLGQLGADVLTASAPKFGGPRGVGLLALGPNARVAALLPGDDRQGGRRGGLEDVPGATATAVALEVANASIQADHTHRELLRRRLREVLPEAVSDVVVHGPLAETHPGIVSFSCLYVEGEALVAALDEAGYAVHSGSSCATRTNEPSHVLVAMEAVTHGHVRVSIGPETTRENLDGLVATLAEVVPRLRAITGRHDPVAGEAS